MRKLAIVGYGKMGKLIEQLAPEYDFQVALRLDEFNNPDGAALTAAHFQGVDVAIEFSIPAAVPGNVEGIAALGIPLVVGTTGWLEHIGRVKRAVEAHHTGLVWSPNFSIGVSVFFRLVAEAARLLAAEPAYGAWAWEIHHSAKKDAPSGTLLKLVEQMKKAGYARHIDVGSNRAGTIPGTHEIGFD
ncbi:MAG: dihydrodipicolinate reductase, partial [Candidatus Solibacter sp.]|nr:dihydrodipicolinate reductase [Candidatus Solibacter sp.]